MPGRPADYYAYLIRLWRTEPDGPWRAGLEDARTGERLGFRGLSEAFAYLLMVTEQATDTDAPLLDGEDDGPSDTPTSIRRCG